MNKRLFISVLTALLLLSNVSSLFVVKADEIVYEEKKVGIVNDDYINVRSGPGVNNSALKIGDDYVYLFKGDEVSIIGEDKDSDGRLWYKVEFNYKGTDYTRWVISLYVDIKDNETNNDDDGETTGGDGEETENPSTPVPVVNKLNEGTVIYSDVRVRTGPGTNYAMLQINGVYQYYDFLQNLKVLGEYYDGSGDLWYKVELVRGGNTYHTFIYGDYLQLKVVIEDDGDFEDYLNKQGFPETYKEALRQLHGLHPSWKFIAYKTGYSWDTVINNESRLGYSLIQSSNLAYRNVAEGSYNVHTKTWTVFDGSNWYAANKQTVGYYIDPRNFLNEINIFMFLNLSFKESETADAVQKLLNGTFMSGVDKTSGKKYSQIFYEAGKKSLASPVYLAALAKQEQGTSGSTAITGGSFTYNGQTYSGLYNFYNIGATSGYDNWKKGLIYANGGEYGTNRSTSYNRPWTTVEKSIVGGAMWIADGYINVGQDTMYFQKFNVTKYSPFGHQYMTNIQAPYSQSSSMFDTYKASGGMDQQLVFTIPVYENMPIRTELPTSYKLPTTVAEQRAMAAANPTIEPDPEPEPIVYTGDFVEDLNLSIKDGFISGFNIETKYTQLKKDIELTQDDSKVVVKNSNGQEIADNDYLATGQTIEVTDKDGTSTYTIIIKGDVNGDGKVDILDMVKVKRVILGYEELEGNALKASQVNGQSSPNLLVFVAIKRHILGYEKVPQK